MPLGLITVNTDGTIIIIPPNQLNRGLNMFIVNNSQCLNINTDVSDQDLNYELSIPQKSQPFVWSENLDYFLETCQDAINSFIYDCKEDSFEDLD